MAKLKDTARNRGMGGFLQVTALMEQQPDITEFFSIVTGTKDVPPGVENASMVLILDETPQDGVQEVALNMTNTKRVIAFLTREFGDTEESLLVDCAIHFRIREFKGYQVAGTAQYGLEIKAIEPPNLDTHRAMVFEAAPPPQPVATSHDVESPAQKRRREIQQRLDAAKQEAADLAEANRQADEIDQAQLNREDFESQIPAAPGAKAKPAKKRK